MKQLHFTITSSFKMLIFTFNDKVLKFSSTIKINLTKLVAIGGFNNSLVFTDL